MSDQQRSVDLKRVRERYLDAEVVVCGACEQDAGTDSKEGGCPNCQYDLDEYGRTEFREGDPDTLAIIDELESARAELARLRPQPATERECWHEGYELRRACRESGARCRKLPPTDPEREKRIAANLASGVPPHFAEWARFDAPPAWEGDGPEPWSVLLMHVTGVVISKFYFCRLSDPAAWAPDDADDEHFEPGDVVSIMDEKTGAFFVALGAEGFTLAPWGIS